jgi:hypothetical protein
MHQLCRSEKRFPRGFYEKAQELQKQAAREPDPALKKLEMDAAKRYYEEDVRPKESFLMTLFALLICWMVTIAVAVWTFHTLGLLSAVGSVIGSFAVLSLLTGVALRAAGYISESTLLGMLKMGFKTLLLLRTKANHTNPPTHKEDTTPK